MAYNEIRHKGVNKMIRIKHVNKLIEIPSDEYSRSEENEVIIRVTYCHPDDYQHLTHKATTLNAGLDAVISAYPEIPSWIDGYDEFLEWAKYNFGSYLPEKIEIIDNEIHQWAAKHFSTPEWTEVEDEVDSSWKEIYQDLYMIEKGE